MPILIPILSVSLLTAIVALIVLIIQSTKKAKTSQESKEALNKYKGIIDVESEVVKRTADLTNLTSKITKLEIDYKEKDDVPEFVNNFGTPRDRI